MFSSRQNKLEPHYKNAIENFINEWAGFLLVEDVEKAKSDYLEEKYS
jgi:RNA polymerase subunit RPABC4/transcription elongation factor Spt4